MIKEQRLRVTKILEDYPYARDNDNHLLSIIWGEDIQSSKDRTVDKFMTTVQFLQLLSDGKLTNFESVRRVRQKIQADNPALRGSNYNKRQDELEREVREEIRELTFDEKFGEKKYIKKQGDMF